MEMKKIDYYVTFEYEKENGEKGTASKFIESDNPLETRQGFDDLVEYLHESQEAKSVLIINLFRLSNLTDEEETICHCNMLENADLIARILDADKNYMIYGEK